MHHQRFAIAVVWLVIASFLPRFSQAADEPAWRTAYRQPPPSAEETRDLMMRLARFVHDNHLKKSTDSPQRGMIYEYLDMRRKGQLDQFVQGEALDTMHDGAWFAAAICNAWHVSGDDFYKRLLVEWQLPFYCRMLNHSDTLFTSKRDDARTDAHRFNREHALQQGEKGFVPYFWDDGGSVSLERRRDKNPLGPFSCVDNLAGKPNPNFLLDGYSLGSSNHLAQDLGVMLQLAWLALEKSSEPREAALRGELAEAAKNLQACRMRHHGHIPMCDAPAALAGDADLMRHLPDPQSKAYWTPDNHYFRALYAFKPAARNALAGFADDQQYRYYSGLAKNQGQLARPLAFKTIYDAYTEPMLYRYYSDDAPVPPGINRFDLHPYYFVDGKPTDYRSDRKGPSGGPRPIGSRMGPQNMICCGWALMALRTFPGIWEEAVRARGEGLKRVYIVDALPGSAGEDKPYTPCVSSAKCQIALRSSREALLFRGTSRGEATVRVFSAADGQGSFAELRLVEGKIAATESDDEGDLSTRAILRAVGDTFSFEIELPYTVVKGQKAWANGVELGVYSIQVDTEPPVNFCLASDKRQVAAWLERELAGGLRTWDAIFEHYGYIPSGIQAGGDWEFFSDTGGYAHLISAASQWLEYQQADRRP